MMNLQSIIKDLSNVVADNMAYEEKRAILQNTYKTIKDDLNLFLGVFDEEIENWSVEDSLSVNSDMTAIMSTKKVFKGFTLILKNKLKSRMRQIKGVKITSN